MGIEHQLDLRFLPTHGSPARALSKYGMGLLRWIQGQPADGFRLRPRGPLLLLPWNVSAQLYEPRYDRTLRGAVVEIPLVQVQLERQQQDLRDSGFARFVLPRSHRL